MSVGNSFSSVHLPFKRMLRCAKCKSERAIEDPDLPFQFNSGDFTFQRRCPKCKVIGRHMVQDYRNPNSKLIRLVRWDPKRITIEPMEITGDCRYWLDIPVRTAAKVRMGDPYTLSKIPWTFMAAIKKNQKYLFKDDMIYHMRESSLAGVFLSGWGIPSILSAFKNFFRLQVLLRYDETLMMDYIVPLRILSPREITIPSGNDFVTVNMEEFTGNVENGIRRHRIDGADWLLMPYAVEYQAIGAEGQQLSHATKDVIAQEEDRLLQVRGIPSELYRGNMTVQAAPVALRLFERGHMPMVNGFNRLLQWMATSVCNFLDMGDLEVELESVKIVDNIEDKQWRLQAALSGAISKGTGLGPLGIDNTEEVKRKIQEQVMELKETTKAQQDAQMADLSLDSQGADAKGQGGGGGMTPGDVESQGDEMARQLLDPQIPESNRRQQLSSLNETNPTLHAVVLKKMEQLRGKAGTAGQVQGLQQLGIGKSAEFIGMHGMGRILWMADAFFPSEKRHVVTYERGTQKMALHIAWNGRQVPVVLDDADMEQEPMELMASLVPYVLKAAA